MADEQETIADIIAEYRADADKMDARALYQPTTQYVRKLLDRLEAAHRRELAAGGNAAKLREAVKRIVAASVVAKNANAPEWILQRMADIFAMATTALAAPPRNCDVMDWRTAWKTWREKFHPETPVGYSAVVKGTEAFMDWFTAPATEQEGGAKLAIEVGDWCCSQTDDPLECCEYSCVYQVEPHGEAGVDCLWKKIRAALAEPPRNCEVGTPKEQSQRFDAFCVSHYAPPNKDGVLSDGCDCPCYVRGKGCNAFVWGQLPYVEQKGGAE